MARAYLHPFSALLAIFSLLLPAPASAAGLRTGFYAESCPKLLATVKQVVGDAIRKEPRMGASLLRLHFHDCFVNGCDASVLLDDKPGFVGEKNANPNRNSARGFEVVDGIKAAVESVCPGVVSCADILTIAARDSVVALRGRYWDVTLGRRDAKTASISAANSDIPAPTFNLSQLIQSFRKFNLSPKDMVALSGAHTIGQARCTNFRTRIYNENNIDKDFAKQKRRFCPSSGSDNNLQGLDVQTATCFDNKYFDNLVHLKGLLHSDQQLFTGGSTDSAVRAYSGNDNAFFADFVAAMIKMGNIGPLTGNAGEIRKNCRSINN